ncbi:MAG: LysR substrate-binding domain-containing protein [Mesorhizobium sp.]
MNWLRAFEASARHLSFTQAALELNLTQAGVSKQIKLLEHHLREKLFIRRARSLELTSCASAYLPKVRDAFERLSAGALEVFGDRRSRMLTVRSNVSFAVNWLAPRFADYRNDHPDKPVRLVSSVWRTDDEGYHSNDHADLEIQYGTSGWKSHRIDRLTTERIFPVCSPELLRRNVLKTPQDLTQQVLISVLGYEVGWDAWLNAAGVNVRQISKSQQVDTSLMAFELAAQGVGVALGRASLAIQELSSGRLVQPFSMSVEIEEGFFMLSPAPEIEHPHARTFRDWIVAQVSK